MAAEVKMATSDVEQPGWLWRWRLWLPQRKTASPETLLPALVPYHSLERHRVRNILVFSALSLFYLVYGFFFAAFVPTYFAFFMFPVILLIFLVIWALPNVNWAPTGTLQWLFYATFVAVVVWPNYLAIALPGLPWITMIRLTSFPLTLTLLVCLSMSQSFRRELKQTLQGAPAIPILLGIFVFIQLYSIAMSNDVSSSIQKFIVAQTTWTSCFFIAAYVIRTGGQIKRWSKILWAMGVFVSLLAMWEFRIGQLPWVGHIPFFLKVDGEGVESILAPHMRAGTDLYRAEATFSTPLGLGEFLALVLPFVLHFTTRRFPQKTRILAAASIPIVLYGNYLSDAKLGTIASLFGIVLYVLVAAYQNWRRNKSSLVAASTLFGFPIGIGTFIAAVMASHRLSVIIFGNDGSHANSTDARVQQYTMGWQKIMAWPFGYGIGQGGDTLGFGADINGMITIDTYYLSIVLEYGVIGFIVYYGMFAIAIYEGIRRCLISSLENEDRSFLLPISISLICFIVVKSVFSQQDNHPVVFMMLGALVALISAPRKSAKSAAKNADKSVRRKSSRLFQVGATAGSAG